MELLGAKRVVGVFDLGTPEAEEMDARGLKWNPL